ncbi:hypothetical protein L3X38_023324 [Prunus dulcis]|uniref:Uncharacterized protein n=1 Tax=Prunus dulcis TaxID=3755 RepID=A0AAD4VXL6_PRUDU|nr:hypothetical protein L3X38_023324 [Prunus dulcis]
MSSGRSFAVSGQHRSPASGGSVGKCRELDGGSNATGPVARGARRRRPVFRSRRENCWIFCYFLDILFWVTYGLIAAASTRVSNELEAGNPDRAKNSMAASFVDSNSSYAVLREDFASMTPLLAISIIVDSVQGVFSGVARGCGWQHLAAYVNLATCYLLGMTISGLLGFKLKLYAKSLWIDLSKNPEEEENPVLV